MKAILLPLTALIISPFIQSQNLGVGTSSPTRARVEVIGVAGTGNTSAIFGSEGAGMSLQTNWPTLGFNQYRDNPALNGKYMASGYAGIQYFDPGSGTMAIDMLNTGALNTNTPNGYRAMTITTTGVGIRSGTPFASLSVPRGDGIDGTVVFAGIQHWSHFNYSTQEDTYIRSGASPGNVYINTVVPNGNILIGNGSTKVFFGGGGNATHTLQIFDGQFGHEMSLTNEIYNHNWSQATEYNPAGDNMLLYFYYQGVLKGYWLTAGGYYINISDRRLKKDIQPLSPVMDKIRQLRPVRYTMINDNPSQKRSIGFIAQEVKNLFPGQVHIVDDKARKGVHHTDLHTMNYTGFNVIAIKALQEQYQQIKELEAEQLTLLRELQELNKKIDAQ